MIPPQHIAKAYAPQLQLPETELRRLGARIDEDFRAAVTDHRERLERFRSYLQRWRNRVDPPPAGEEDISNFRVPLTQWQVFNAWADEHQSLFGQDAAIAAQPTGPSDQKIVGKVGLYTTWRLFHYMKIATQAMIFNFRKILFGRTHAKVEWCRETFEVPLINGKRAREVAYDGPKFTPLAPDDVLVPAEDVASIQDFSFVIEKERLTPDDLLRGEEEGRFQGITEHFDAILAYSQEQRRRDPESDTIKREQDLAEGVLYDGNLSVANRILVFNWYGRWRKLKGRQDAREDNLKRREKYESDLLVKYIPDLHLVVGVQDLAQMYPRSPKRRPLADASLVKDGSYWCMGFGEMLEKIEDELSVNHNLATQAGQFSVGPVIFYTPAAGFDPDNFEYQPYAAAACDNPDKIRVVETRANLEYPVVKEQTMNGYAERVTGRTDMQMGRAQDRPNAPRTARQTIALIDQGSVRASLDKAALAEDWDGILEQIWSLEQDYAPEQVFFRVTEEEAKGLFDVKDGGAYMTAAERTSRYDFKLRFATSIWSKEAKKEEQLALYQIDLQNPLIAQNPRAMWVLLNNVHKAFGDDNFKDVIPEPPDLGLPKKPKEEWVLLQQGEPVEVNPLDSDKLHIAEHSMTAARERRNPERDDDAYYALLAHIQEHLQQLEQKKLMQEMAAGLAESMKNAGIDANALPAELDGAAPAAQGQPAGRVIQAA